MTITKINTQRQLAGSKEKIASTRAAVSQLLTRYINIFTIVIQFNSDPLKGENKIEETRRTNTNKQTNEILNQGDLCRTDDNNSYSDTSQCSE
jgi:hypothetical protein